MSAPVKAFVLDAPAEHDATVTLQPPAESALPLLDIGCTFRHAGLRERSAMVDQAKRLQHDDAQFLAEILLRWDVGTAAGEPAPVDRLHIAKLLDKLQDQGYDKPGRSFIDAWVRSMEEEAPPLTPAGSTGGS